MAFNPSDNAGHTNSGGRYGQQPPLHLRTNLKHGAPYRGADFVPQGTGYGSSGRTRTDEGRQFMRELFLRSQSRYAHRWLWAGALIAYAAGSGGCTASHDVSTTRGVEASLFALMEDGTLPFDMAAASDEPRPPRFCSDGGGVFPPPIAIGSTPTPSAGIAIAPTIPPGVPGQIIATGGTAGSAAASIEGAGGSLGSAVIAAVEGEAGMSAVAPPTLIPPPPPTGAPPPDAQDGDDVPQGDPCARTPIGFWRFDNCSEFRTDLFDSSNQGHPAFRAVDQQCVPGQEGQAMAFSKPTDLVYAPDQPDFDLSEGVTVAAWVRPERIDGARTIFRKRDDGSSAFALLIHNSRYQFVVRLSTGRMATVSGPAVVDEWTHIAATYDGSYLRLYLNGEEVDSRKAVGTLAEGPGPLLIGNDASERRVIGLIDNAWFNTLAAPPETIAGLLCLHPEPRLNVTPTVGPAVAPGTVVNYTLTLTNTATPTCDPSTFELQVFPPQGLSANNQFVATPPLAPGETISQDFEVFSQEGTEAGSYTVEFNAFSFEIFTQTAISAEYVVAEPEGCHVTSSRELTIRHVSVVDDPVRTSMDGDGSDPRTGAWSFGRFMERLSPTPQAAPKVTEEMFASFITAQDVNGFEIEARPAMDEVVLQPWPRTSAGELDLARAPLRLLAIVHRLDLKDLNAGKAGEGRIVYGVLDAFGNSMEFTVILEYALPADTEEEFRAWANTVHALQELPFPSEEYNTALQAITDRFSAHGALPGAPNDSALIDIRTNEIALSFQWQLREFRLSPADGFLAPSVLFQTPDFSFNFTDTLGRFINENEDIILTERHEVPLQFEGIPFQTGGIFNNIDFWSAPGINNPEARHKFSLNTCNGCHGQETNTFFLHINPRQVGEQSLLSDFQLGTTVFDPETGEPRQLSELSRRRKLLESVVCPDDTTQ